LSLFEVYNQPFEILISTNT